MKFVSHGTVSAIKNADEGMSRGGERKRVSVLFSDIRGDTEFAERVSPEVVIEALNQYFEAQTAIVETHNGDVDKFIGDALVAVFEGDDMERRAITCAVQIIDAMAELLERFPEYNLHVGIGVASGEVVMGAMGAKSRMDYTVLGSTVNLSARLCSMAAPDQFLIDAATLAMEPEVGEVIVTNTRQFEVMKLSGQGCWRWTGPNRKTYRIHTKDIGDDL